MNGKERILTALEVREPDRVPLYIHGINEAPIIGIGKHLTDSLPEPQDFRLMNDRDKFKLVDTLFMIHEELEIDGFTSLGMSQLGKLDRFLARRREIARCYDEAFADLAQVMTPAVRDDRLSAWHLYVIRLALERLRVGRGEVFAALRAENIGVNVHYIPVYWHPYYAQLGYERGLCPVAEDAYERLVTLPLFPAMSDADVADVIAAVHKVMEAYVL